MGALCGAALTYANYIHPIDIVEGGRHIRTVPGTASLFATYAVSEKPHVESISLTRALYLPGAIRDGCVRFLGRVPGYFCAAYGSLCRYGQKQRTATRWTGSPLSLLHNLRNRCRHRSRDRLVSMYIS